MEQELKKIQVTLSRFNFLVSHYGQPNTIMHSLRYCDTAIFFDSWKTSYSHFVFQKKDDWYILKKE
jgi:hypothetical protein